MVADGNDGGLSGGSIPAASNSTTDSGGIPPDGAAAAAEGGAARAQSVAPTSAASVVMCGYETGPHDSEGVDEGKRAVSMERGYDGDLSAGGAPAMLSKNAQKRLAKAQRRKESKVARKLAKKDRKRAARQEAGDAGEEGEGEKKRQRGEGWKPQQRGGQNKKGQKCKEEFEKLTACGQRVVIDLSFDDIMTEREVKSLVTQVAHSYGRNRRSETPLQMHLTSVEKRASEGLSNISGFSNWRCASHNDHYTTVFPKEDIVYLTAESPHELAELDKSKVYIIGGIVDHNKHKGHTHDKAVGSSIATARLPIEGNADLGDHRRVLTVNHVFELMLKKHEGNTWKDCLQSVLPLRKLRAGKVSAGQGGSEASAESDGSSDEDEDLDWGKEGHADATADE